MAKILVLVATMTGTAEMIAEDIAAAHCDRHEFAFQALEKATLEQLAGARTALVVSSTYGEGEVPEPTIPFFNLVRESRPDLSGLVYGAVTLGDNVTYPKTFANGGRLWDGLLTERGATRVGDLLVIDASDPADKSELALRWAGNWLRLIEGQRATAREVSQ
ncbi:flavodoxin domain-containing protein [Bradyrhizobium sp. LjRoot220]